MTDEHDDTPPGADSKTGGPGRRRARVDHVGDELAALRRDLNQQGSLLAELAPRVDELDDRLTAVHALVRRLVEQAHERDFADQAELEARRAAGLADEPPAPWCWPVLDRDAAAKAWTALDRWAATVLVAQMQLPLRRLPGCWPAHPDAVAELSALRAGHVAAHDRGAHPTAALAWHRELPAALDRIAQTIDPTACPPGRHHLEAAQLPPERERERVGTMPCRPEAWRPLLDQVAAADLAARRPTPATPPG